MPTIPDNQQTPVSLLDRLRANTGESDWEAFVEIYSGLILKWLRRAGVAPTDIDDLKQEILLALVKAVPNFHHNGNVGAFRKWLKTLVTQRVLNHFRSRRTDKARAFESTADDLLAVEDRMLTQGWEREHDEHVLQQLMRIVEAHFTMTTWAAFRQQVFGHQSAEKVGQQLGITANAAVIAKSRVLRRLREEARGLVD